MSRFAPVLFAAVILVAAPVAAQSKDCGAAQKGQSCNPRQECLKQAERALTGPALDAARKDCSRMPTAGTCYGNDAQSTQADCQEPRGKKK
jgi:hypothetical protein